MERAMSGSPFSQENKVYYLIFLVVVKVEMKPYAALLTLFTEEDVGVWLK